MRFDYTDACKDCPFRKDVGGVRYLGQRWARDLMARLLENDWEWFPCHKTARKGRTTSNSQHCFGAAVLLWRLHQPNVYMRLALLAEVLKVENLDAPQSELVATVDELMQVQEE